MTFACVEPECTPSDAYLVPLASDSSRISVPGYIAVAFAEPGLAWYIDCFHLMVRVVFPADQGRVDLDRVVGAVVVLVVHFSFVGPLVQTALRLYSLLCAPRDSFSSMAIVSFQVFLDSFWWAFQLL